LAAAQAARYLDEVETYKGVSYLGVRADAAAAVKALSEAIRARFPSGVLAVAGGAENKVTALVSVSDDLAGKGLSARSVLDAMMTLLGGRGGGTASLAQGGGKDASGIPAALEAAWAAVRTHLDG
jgi:alanyl-tRNA synthetase